MESKIDTFKTKEKEKPKFRPLGISGKDSYVVVLPKNYVIDSGFERGDFLKVTRNGGQIILEKAN
jgi:hypothetical protein